MKTADFDYPLPEALIASEPLARRDASRMMVLEREPRRISHARFFDLPQWLRADDLLVLNDTKVIPGRLYATRVRDRGDGRVYRSRVELLMMEEKTAGVWEALVRPGQKVHVGDKLVFGDGEFDAVVTGNTEFGGRVIQFPRAEDAALMMDKYGEPPLPHYIDRARHSHQTRPTDRVNYQTVYAREPGAVAAPTAGLHFTAETFEKLKGSGVGLAYVTLHVGLGTFRPVKADDVENHVMHKERYSIPPETLKAIAETKSRGGRVVAVGTTVVRTVEAAARNKVAQASCLRSNGKLEACPTLSAATDIFIHPPFEFRVVDALLTNFHLPKSTLLMLVSAFASPGITDGREFVLRAYAEAVKEKYRFYSYGDCMLIV